MIRPRSQSDGPAPSPARSPPIPSRRRQEISRIPPAGDAAQSSLLFGLPPLGGCQNVVRTLVVQDDDPALVGNGEVSGRHRLTVEHHRFVDGRDLEASSDRAWVDAAGVAGKAEPFKPLDVPGGTVDDRPESAVAASDRGEDRPPALKPAVPGEVDEHELPAGARQHVEKLGQR